MDLDRRRPRTTVLTAVLALTTLVVLGPTGGSGAAVGGDRPVAPTAASDAVAPEAPGGDRATAASAGSAGASATPAADGPVAPDLPRERSPGGAPEGGAAPGRADDDAEPAEAAEVPPPPAPTRTSDEGFEVVLGDGSAGSGPTVTFTVEVEPATGIAPEAALAVAEDALFDERSWARDVHLHRIDDPAGADIRLVFATPATADRLCGAAGLATHGVYSCWTGEYAGRFAVINSWRYAFGAAGFDDRDEYRRYVVNHEVGHGLGHGHVGCPAAGAPAPVMMQQSASLGACTANGWPYPDA
jgi:hypothetical protein